MSEEILLETGIATLIAVLGGALAAAAAGKRPEAHQRRLLALVSTAAGALLAVTVASILPEAAEVLPFLGALLAVASGYVVFYLIGRYIYPICPACAVHTHSHDEGHGDSCDHPHHTHGPDLRRTATLLGCMVALHAGMDGIAVATGQEIAGRSLHTTGLATALQSLPLLFAVSLHKLPEGLALAALLLGGGFGRAKAFALTAGIESATLLGGALGVTLFASASPAFLGAIMAHTGGGFLYLAQQALASQDSTEPRGSFPRLGYGAIGFVAVALLLWGLHLLPMHHH